VTLIQRFGGALVAQPALPHAVPRRGGVCVERPANRSSKRGSQVGPRPRAARVGSELHPPDLSVRQGGNMEDPCGFRRLAVSFSAAVLALGVLGAHARTSKSRSSRDALKDPDAQPGQSTPRPPKPDRGPNRTGDALQDPDSQPSMGSPRPPKTEQGSESDRRRPPGSRRATPAKHPAAVAVERTGGQTAPARGGAVSHKR
jgi:hypothetical protein